VAPLAFVASACLTAGIRGVVRIAVLGVVFALGAGAALAAGRDSAPPISTTTQLDPAGDASSGGLDISSVSATVSADGTLSLSLTVLPGSTAGDDASLQFGLSTPAGANAMIIAYHNETDLMVANSSGSGWQTVREVPGSLSDGTFSASITLRDLQDAWHTEVTPTLYLQASSYIYPNNQPQLTDIVPDSGWIVVPTEAQTPTTSTDALPTTTTPPPPTTTLPLPPISSGPGVLPYLEQTVVRMSHARVEWKRLIVEAVPPRATVTIACTKGCSLSERPKVLRGAAASKLFVGRPFARGVSFVTRVRQRSGSGWWFRSTVVATTGLTTSAHGCIAKSGALGKC